MGLTTEEQILIEQRVTNEAKSTAATYLLWFFVGWAGAHRFYLGRNGSAIAMLLLNIVGWMTFAFLIGIPLVVIWGIWWLVDLFLIPGMIDAQKNSVRNYLTQEALVRQKS
ncbi:TM2 domain-containing protein [Martelella mediterranea]|uniref:TM2 domain-containing protein n=1 Tax=Martelella mediterranea TaxID=293089 RepID=A0A4V2V524_9HYPH|nr:TM2 domain-containing protein [Martelella mediterranea]TCT45081.1 TM2 domain-containing protein [Martelella mediterranea]